MVYTELETLRIGHVRTSIPGVDEILDGKGIPRGYVVFINGAPGSGKTTFAMQYLYNGATKFDEPGIYVSLDESPRFVINNMKPFGLDLRGLIDEEKILMLDLSPIRRLNSQVKVKREFSLEKVIDKIKRSISKIGAMRIVIDPLTMLTIEYPKSSERIFAVMDLLQALVETECTTIVNSELRTSSVDREYQLEEYLSQGIVLLRTVAKPGGLIRVFQVEKMRGVKHDPQPHPYLITEKGIEVYYRENVL